MPLAESIAAEATAVNRASLARERAHVARQLLDECHFCAHHCGVNRNAGETGPCHAGAQARFFAAQTEVTDELELAPAFNVALSGCDLRCDFCITGGPSWNPRAGVLFEPRVMAKRAVQALAEGARCVQILGGEPAIHLAAALEFVAALPANARLVWKTNAHSSAEARRLLDGMFDVWVADLKFGNDACALRLARVSDYSRIVRENLVWAEAHTDLIVRHLLMPGHLECCWFPVARWLAAELPHVKVSLRSAFWPAWRSGRHPELRRPVSVEEARLAEDFARDLGLNLVN